MNQQPINISNELRPIHKELALLRENQMFTARAVKALPSDFLAALESMRDESKKPAGMSRTKRALLNLFLIIVFCVGIFFLFWAIRPARAQAPQVAPGWFITGEWQCGPHVRIVTSTDGGDGIDFLIIGHGLTITTQCGAANSITTARRASCLAIRLVCRRRKARGDDHARTHNDRDRASLGAHADQHHHQRSL
jgi:hypothetical protein